MKNSPLRLGDVEAEARAAAADRLPDLSAAASAAIAVADRVMAEVARAPEQAAALTGAACQPGCGWCCHQVVGITAAEEVLLAEAIEALPRDRRARIGARQAAAEARLARLPVSAWQAARVPCPLLEDGACVVHAGRPLPCRAVLSADAGACRRWLEGEADGIPLVASQRRVYSLAQAGLAQALAAAGIPPGPVSLVEALQLL